MIKIGIVGTGSMGNYQAGQFAQIKGCRLQAVFDVNPAVAEAFAKTHGIAKVCKTSDELLECVDAVSIVTPDRFHEPLAVRAFEAGRHVLCEKPLAEDAAAAERMVKAAKKSGLVNMVNLSYRVAAPVHKAHELVERGVIGEVVHFEACFLQSWLSSRIAGDWRTKPGFLWRLSSKHGGKGALGDTGIHVLDLISHVAGPIAAVQCRLKSFERLKGKTHGKYRLDTNDSAVATIELKNGALGVMHASRWATGKQNVVTFRIHGTQGAIEADLGKSYEELSVCRGADIHKAKWRVVKCGSVPSNYLKFVRAIRRGEGGRPDFGDGLNVQRVLDACLESAEQGAVVRL